jgi:hypothetical protein
MPILISTYTEWRHRTKHETEKWGAGPWDDEPDAATWLDATSLYPSHAYRNTLGAWCGYVGVPEGHVLWGKGYANPWYNNEDATDVAIRQEWKFYHTLFSRVPAHRGITFDDFSAPYGVAEDRWPDYYWIGFDCAHSGDYVPGMILLYDNNGKTIGKHRDQIGQYRKFDFVKQKLHDMNVYLHMIRNERYEDERNKKAAAG